MTFGQTGIYIGNLQIVAYYGIILMFGAVVAAFLADFRARQRGLDSEIVWDGLVYVLIAGIIGARLWHVFTPPPSMMAQGFTTQFYLTHPLDLLNLRKGGLGIPGAVIGGALALLWYTHKKGLSFMTWADIAAPGVPLAQAIGRWGNFINQEVYGAPSNLPWAITIDPLHRLPEYQDVATYHPLFAYEGLWNLLTVILIFWLEKRFSDKLKPGDMLLTYLVSYPLARFFLEFIRLDASQIAGVNFNQVFMLVIAIAAAVVLFLRHRPGAEK
jgi:phosphatidylglycerol---prolipoprotein diacylglyceryl transferase